MTRQQIIRLGRDLLGELQGDPGADSLVAWPSIVSQAANDIAAKYKCFSGTASADLVANQVRYSAPTSTAQTTNVDVIEIYAASCYDSTGNLHMLQPATEQWMDASIQGWRLCAAGLCPTYLVTLAQNYLLMVPAPSYASAYNPTTGIGGYTVEGIAIPAASWEALTAECPLPTQCHKAVVYQACLDRIIRNPSAENMVREPMIQRRLQSELDTFESSVLRYTQATRVPSYTTGINLGANPTYGFNPLDLEY